MSRIINFDDQLNILLFACYATKPFSVQDIQEAVVSAHRATLHSQLRNFVEQRYLEKVADNQYRATLYAKDIMNVKREFVA